MLRAAIIALLVLAAPADAAVSVDAGGLRATLDGEPVALRATDRDGDVLATGAGPGRIAGIGYAFDLRQPVVNNAYFGYEIAAEAELAWFRATRIVEVRPDGSAIAATDDPLGHQLELRLERAADGVVRLRVALASGPLAQRGASAVGVSFVRADDERLLGFGSRSNAVDQAGNRVFSWAEEGPFSSGNGEALRPLLPGFTFPTGPTATNFPIPWTVTTRGFGVLLESTERSTFDVPRAGGAWSVEVEGPRLALVLVGGPRPADVVRRYSGLAGRQPRPAGWLFGPWVQFHTGMDERFVRDDVPTSVSQTYTHYLPCGAGRDPAPERARVARAHALGMKITTYFNPHVCTTYAAVYAPAAAAGLFVENALGEPYLLTNPFTADQIVSEIDFSLAEGRALYGRLIGEAIERGYDGWMEDFGEYTPTDAVLSDGTTGLAAHNRYTVLYHCASYEHSKGRAPAVFIRSGFHGVQPCARAVWGGDPTEDWSCTDGLCAAVHQLLNQGLSGIAYQGSDIGGFHAIVNPRTDDELNVRWAQVGFASGIMRTQANGYSFRDNRADRSQVWSPAVQPIWRRYAKLRTQLFPYLSAASAEYQRSGMPLARHGVLLDPSLASQHDAYGFGPDLFVAPVLRPGARERRVRLPEGEWVDLWRSVAWDDGPGTIRVRAPRLVSGTVALPAPLEELPLLARAGAVLPLTAPDVDTLATLGDARTVSLHERRGRLRLVAFPRGRWSGRFYGRGHGVLRSTETRHGWALRIRSSRRRTVDLEASLRTLRRPFRPCAVTLDGRRVRFTASDGILRARFRVRTGTLRALRRC